MRTILQRLLQMIRHNKMSVLSVFLCIAIFLETYLLFKFSELVRFEVFDAPIWIMALIKILAVGAIIAGIVLQLFRPQLFERIFLKIHDAIPFIHHHAKRNYTILHTHSKTWLEQFQQGSRRTRIMMISKPLLIIFAIVLFMQTKHNFVPPKILVSFPDAKSSEAPLDTTIEVIFDRPMIRQTVERNLIIQPHIAGTFSWESDQKIIFKPSEKLNRATQYQAVLKGTVLSKYFMPLMGERTVAFTTIGNPKVVLTSPASAAIEDLAPITVMFDRAMIPLTTATNSAVKKAAFTINPPLEGAGRWLGTTAYQFRPTTRFRQATTYTASLIPGQSSQDGGTLPDGYSWSFSSEKPHVDRVIPPDGEMFASTTASIAAVFNQELNAESVSSRFKVLGPDNKEIAGTIKILGRMAAFQPKQPLKREQAYTAYLDRGIQSVEGPNGSEDGRSWRFTVAAFPQVLSSDPKDGEQNITEQHSIQVYFKTPMDEASFDKNVTIDPAPSKNPATYFSSYQGKHILSISTYLGRSTNYTITIGAGAKDQHGVTLGKPYTFHFTTAPYQPSVAIYPSGTYFGSFNQKITPRIVVQTVNTSKIKYTLYKLGEDDLMHLYDRRYGSYCSGNSYHNCWNWQDYDPGKLEKVRTWEETYDPDLNTPVHVVTKVTAPNGSTTPSGFYYLDVRIPQGPHDNMVMIVSRSTLTVKKSENQIFAWAVDQSTGNVIPGMHLKLGLLSKQILTEGDTNNDGVLMKNVDLYNKTNLFMWGKKDDDLVVATEAWSDGINRYDFGLPYHYNPQEQTSFQTKDQYKFYLTLDRPIYRPGQKVYFKGVVRKDNDSAYENLPAGEEIQVDITDAENRSVYTTKHALTSFGSFSGDFTLAKEANLGYYQVRTTNHGNTYMQQFQVEEYRKPEIAVAVTSAKQSYTQSERADVTVDASYYFGAPVADASLTWRLQTSDYSFRWNKDTRFEFGDSDSYWYRPWWYFSDSYSFGELVTEGKGITNAKGAYDINLPLDISKYTSDQRMTVEAVVTDVSNQAIAASSEFIVRKSDLRVGLRPMQYVNKSGTEAKVELVTLDNSDKEIGGQKITLSFYKRTWETVREKNADDGQFYYVSKPHDTFIAKSEATSDQLGRATGSFTPPEGGVYKAVAEVTDSKGRTAKSGAFMWVSGFGASFPRENHDRITLVTDKDKYTVGETASIFVASPYASASAKTLLTAERGSVLDYKIVDTNESSNNFPIDIQPKFSPNTFLGAILVKPGTDVANPAEFKIGYAEVQVTDKKTQIEVKIQTDKPRYKPGEHMKMSVETKDLLGHPLASEVAVGIVDQAVWDLAQVQIPGIFETYYQPRNLGVDTSQLLTISIDRINANTNLGAKGGSGGGCFTGDTPILMHDGTAQPIEKIRAGDIVLTRASETSARLVEGRVKQTFKHTVPDYLIINGSLKVTSIHRLLVNGTWQTAGTIRIGDSLLDDANMPVQVYSIEYVTGTFDVYNLEIETYRTYFAGGIYVHNQKGGDMNTSRREFLDTAYWNPELKTGEDGRASIDIKLPDNLTTWHLSAIANTDKAAFGSQTAKVIVSRDVLIRPFLPRFLAIGDEAQLGAIIVNTSGKQEKLTAKIKAEGLSIDENTAQSFTLDDGAQRKITWPTFAKNTKQATITLSVAGEDGVEKDSMQVSLPIRSYSIPEVVATAGEARNTAQETILLPKEIDTTQGFAELSFSPSLGTASFNGFPYLQDYMYYCTEQTTSRLMPAVYLYRIMKSAGIKKTGAVELAQLEAVMSQSIQKLQNEQHSDGGWGWWIDHESDEYITAYAYAALKEAKNNKLTVDDSTLNRARVYLKNSLGYASVDMDTRAFMMYTLRGEGINLSSFAATLYERRFELSVEARAYLVIVMNEIGSMKQQTKQLRNEVISLGKKTATTTHWEEAGKHRYWYIGSNTITNAVVLEMLTLTDSRNPLIAEIVRYLMSNRTENRWATTRDTSAVIKAISVRLIAQGDEKVDETYKILLNGKLFKETGFTKADILALHTYTLDINKFKIGEPNKLSFTKSGSGNLYYNINMKYYLPFHEIKPLEQGIVVVRELIDQKGNLLSQNSIKEGTEAWMRLIIAAPEERHYVAVEDILPAGLESVNESLKNVSVLNAERPETKDKENRTYYFNRREYHDDRTSLFARYLPPGVYEITYRVRATTPGKYHHAPAQAYQMYVPDVSGHSDGGWFEVK